MPKKSSQIEDIKKRKKKKERPNAKYTQKHVRILNALKLNKNKIGKDVST